MHIKNPELRKLYRAAERTLSLRNDPASESDLSMMERLAHEGQWKALRVFVEEILEGIDYDKWAEELRDCDPVTAEEMSAFLQ